MRNKRGVKLEEAPDVNRSYPKDLRELGGGVTVGKEVSDNIFLGWVELTF